MDSTHTLVHENRTRYYEVHLPADRTVDAPLPVVLNFHGGLGSADSQRRQSGMNRVADEHGFAVVYPEGTGRVHRRLLTFNAGRCCGYAVRLGVDDVGFVDRLLDELGQVLPVDPQRVYATGMSNGGMLAYRLACELSHRIAAIGPVAGGMMVEAPPPPRPVPILHVHGLRDRNAVYGGGVGPNAMARVPHPRIADVLAWWRQVNGCGEEPLGVAEDADSRHVRWAPPPGAAGAPVELLALPEGGHTWPGGEDVSAVLDTGPLIRTVDASSILWRFFRAHSLPA